MPSKSPAQHRLMEAAAHTAGGYGGVPQSVGQEFVRADAAKPRHDARHPKTGRFIPAKTVPAQSNRVGYGTRAGVTATQ